MIDFADIAAASLARSRTLIPQWLAGGKWEGPEYVCKNPKREGDRHAGSFKVNSNTGKWADFATDQKGGDLVSLFAFLNGLSQADAAHQLAVEFGLGPSSNGGTGRNGKSGDMHAKGITLAEFARAKGLPEEFLVKQGVKEHGRSLVFEHFLADGQRAGRHHVRTALQAPNNWIWSSGSGDVVAYGLWRLNEFRMAGLKQLHLVEGESDSLTLWLHGMAALGIPGASACAKLQAAHLRGFDRVFIVRERDEQGGETFVTGMQGRLAELRYQGAAHVIEMPEGIKDTNELHHKHLGDPGGFETAWRQLCEAAPRLELPFVGAIRQRLSSVAAEQVEWIWPGRLPLGKLVLFAGDSGLGKSTVALDLAARLSRGGEWPDGRRAWKPSCSLILTAEDGVADTVRPRMEMLGADLDRIEVISIVRAPSRQGEIIERGFNLITDLPMLEDALRENAEIRLVDVDPVSSYLGSTDTHKNADVRTVLAPLGALAEKYRTTIIMITHLNKGDGSAQHRVTGSIAFVAASRAAYLFTVDPNDDDAVLFLPLKNNLARRGSGLRYRIVEDCEGRATLLWGGETQSTAEDVFAEEALGRKPKQRAEAIDLLFTLLRDGAKPMREIERESAKRGIAPRTLIRAKEQLRVESFRDPESSVVRWLWRLPAGS